jgi:allantoinase
MSRDYIGYGMTPPRMAWPGGALLPVVFVINLEEGSEPSIEDGDGYSEWLLTEGTGPAISRPNPCSSSAAGSVSGG